MERANSTAQSKVTVTKPSTGEKLRHSKFQVLDDK